MGSVATFWISYAIIISILGWFQKHNSKISAGFGFILTVLFLIVALPFVLIRDFIYRVILDRTVYTGLTFLKPRNVKERRIKAWIERSRERKKKEREQELFRQQCEERARGFEKMWAQEKRMRGY